MCSTVHPLLAASPFFRRLDLEGLGLRLLTPRVAFAHPLDGGRAAAAVTSLDDTVARLGVDGAEYRRLLAPFLHRADQILAAVLSPMRSIPPAPIAATRFALTGLLPAERLAQRFKTDEAQALVAGVAAHAGLPLTAPVSGGFGLVMMLLAHSVGWPVIEGGSSGLVDALIGELESLGGRVITGHRSITSLEELPQARTTLLDVDTRQLASLGGARLSPPDAARALGRLNYGPASARSTGRSAPRCRGRQASAERPPRCTSEGRWPRSLPVRRTWQGGVTRSVRTASWSSQASLTRPGHQPASRRSGRTATYRRDRLST